MPTKFTLFLLLVICLSCVNNERSSNDSNTELEITFDETKWKIMEGNKFPYRDTMLKDLMTNKTYRALKKNELLELLGKPTKIDNNHFFYRINQRQIGAWTLHTKTLVIKLFEDGSIEWMKIHE